MLVFFAVHFRFGGCVAVTVASMLLVWCLYCDDVGVLRRDAAADTGRYAGDDGFPLR